MNYFVLYVQRLLRWYASPADGGRYDMREACPHCGTGSVRLDPLFVVSSACKAGVAATYKQQIVVSSDVHARLVAAGVRSLRRALGRNREPVNFWSLEPEMVLPAWSRDSKGFERSEIQPPCVFCHRDGFYDRPKESLSLIYDIDPGVDICATWEHFGASRLDASFDKSLFASPRLIVSERVREVLDGSKGVSFAEVKFKIPNEK